jgi:hypothetical protein
MKIKRFLFLINSLWELARLFLLFAALTIAFRRPLLEDRSAVYWLVLLGSAQLLLPAALLLLYLDPARFDSLLNLVRLGKFLGILAALMLVFLVPLTAGVIPGGAMPLPFAVVPFTMVVGITIADLVFLFLLFLWSGGVPQAPAEGPGELPQPRGTSNEPRPGVSG